MLTFTKAYIKSMRLYYSFITGIAGFVGVAFYRHIAENFHTVEIIPSTLKTSVILAMLFLSWGINQIVNDYLGLKEDKINAPNRPMVTGELNKNIALLVSIVLITTTALITWFYLEKLALIPLFAGVILNVIYEYAKGYGILGNIIFGLMLTQCTIYGFLASGPTSEPYFTSSRVSVLLIIFALNAIMTFYTYFKDYKGDKLAGKNTIVVKFGLHKARYFALAFSLVPASLFLFFYFGDFIVARANNVFLILSLVAFFLQLWTGILYFRNPVGKEAYYSLSVNFRACCCSQCALIALFNQELAMVLFILSYVLVEFLFKLYSDTKA
ncbi:MAG: ubiquinone biosynthesis protein UbiA [Bacteroidetes bacterium RIFOXYA12_FULL_35_11]|nr:MAG: ubiquinone biosynthesis protein UbiA [Bacteroidetes bacterium GWF2_35_48]OFY83181.1 MAG: ubiquinone biosynthesis protein UbiA [Bacteroidetes bacterium RIFOXYA12_FULL_35_11]OFY97357.1 MAG: ubiquinone biosynthesis protein UbiA [Bacteroidetes bacterium RIFOXYC12_FULL_35_7]HBX51215.1 ubiquinone biosynthesis protein UbiA [Bacteroidales bacterium]